MTTHGFAHMVPQVEGCGFSTSPAFIASRLVCSQILQPPRQDSAMMIAIAMTVAATLELSSISIFMCFGLSFFVYV